MRVTRLTFVVFRLFSSQIHDPILVNPLSLIIIFIFDFFIFLLLATLVLESFALVGKVRTVGPTRSRTRGNR
jgi:uncharacterized phage infection (PIP) family protein YhgE